MIIRIDENYQKKRNSVIGFYLTDSGNYLLSHYSIFTSSSPYIAKYMYICSFRVKFWKWKDRFTRFEVSWNRNNIFSSWSVCVCMCVCQSVISTTPELIGAEIPNLVFYICIINRCYLKLLWRSDKKSAYSGTKKNLKTSGPVDGISSYYIFRI